jgi:predicted RNA-binding Zn-ribbon protein involved in translation (DUF1610 family)
MIARIDVTAPDSETDPCPMCGSVEEPTATFESRGRRVRRDYYCAECSEIWQTQNSVKI